MGCDIWILSHQKCGLCLLKRSLQHVGGNATMKNVVALLGTYYQIQLCIVIVSI
jgi:hypothetical protein